MPRPFSTPQPLSQGTITSGLAPKSGQAKPIALETKKAEDVSPAFFVQNLALAPTAAEHQLPASPSVPSQR